MELFTDYRRIISDGYYSKMTTETSQRKIPPRQDKIFWKDLKRIEDDVILTVTERWREKKFSAIDKGDEVDVCIGIRIETSWQKTDVNISNGLDFQASGSIYVRFTHLNYEPFSYRWVADFVYSNWSLKIPFSFNTCLLRISADNYDQMTRMGTVRIIFVPINNQANQLYKFNGSRRAAIELDQFVVNCK